MQRPDLPDSHTIHWHGFDVPTPLNDGVPEVSVAVPIGKQLTYFYRPHRAGTYMYHCHWEDVEHVQMGMTGIVFVRRVQDGTPKVFGGKTYTKFAYNDGDGSTGYDRHFAILLNEVDERQHDDDRDIQVFIPTDYDPQCFTLNGRCYPQTVLPNDVDAVAAGRRGSPDLHRQPDDGYERLLASPIRRSSRSTRRTGAAPPGQPRLHHRCHGTAGHPDARHRPGCVVAARRQRSVGDRHLVLGPTPSTSAPARLATCSSMPPPTSASAPGGSDSRGNYNVYYFKNRDWRKLSNNGLPGPGGMMTEVRVYQSALPSPDRREPDLCLRQLTPARRERKARMTLRTRWLGPAVALVVGATLLAPSAVGALATGVRRTIGMVCTPGTVSGTTHTFNLVANTGYIGTPDGNSVFMWSYADRRRPELPDVPVTRSGPLRHAGRDGGRQPPQHAAGGDLDRLPRPGRAGDGDGRLARAC